MKAAIKAGKLSVPGLSNLKPPVQSVVRSGIEWIALNDEPRELSSLAVSYNISTTMLADITGLDACAIASEIVKLRKKWIARERRDAKKLETENVWKKLK